TSQDSTSIFDGLKKINFTTWLLIILILAFLGFNIFVYLAKGTESIRSIFAPLFEKIFGTSLLVTGETVDVAAEGAKTVVTGTANALNTGLTAVQDITPNSANSSIKSQPVQETSATSQNVSANNTLNKALNSSQPPNQDENDYEAHEASSSVHSAGKAGWCFIGEDRGFRSCAQVGVNDQCMSGDIFPSQELCINPNLRA
ncbi:MAG: hypothetical protein EBY22_12620, partial [Gammaproteobacteria bacterium]|nr:hypothetical protein [Gammaproteobacteria bacterium]